MSYQTPSTPSGSLAVGTNVVLARPGHLTTLVLNPGSAVSTVTVYNNASAASGTIILSLTAPANGASVVATLPIPVQATLGLTVVVAGTAATAHVHYNLTY